MDHEKHAGTTPESEENIPAFCKTLFVKTIWYEDNFFVSVLFFWSFQHEAFASFASM